jgi:hypothetical protein
MTRILAALLLPIVLPLAVIGVNRPLIGEPIPFVQQPRTELVWADRVFTSQTEFASFLASRGASYETWAANHPGAAPWEERSARTRDIFAAWAAASLVALLLLAGPPRLPARTRRTSGKRRSIVPSFSLPRPNVAAWTAPAGVALFALPKAAAAAAQGLRRGLGKRRRPRIDAPADPAGRRQSAGRPRLGPAGAALFALPKAAAAAAQGLRRGLGKRRRPRFDASADTVGRRQSAGRPRRAPRGAAVAGIGIVSYAAPASVSAARHHAPIRLELGSHLVAAPASAARRVRRELEDRGPALVFFYVVGAVLAVGVGPFIVLVMSRM